MIPDYARPIVEKLMKKGEDKEKIGFGTIAILPPPWWNPNPSEFEIGVAHGKGFGIFSARLPFEPHEKGGFWVDLLNSTAGKHNGPQIDCEAFSVKRNYVDPVVDYIWNFLTAGMTSSGVVENDQSEQRALEYIRKHGAQGAAVWIMQARK